MDRQLRLGEVVNARRRKIKDEFGQKPVVDRHRGAPRAAEELE